MNNIQIAELFIEQHAFQRPQMEELLEEANLNGKTLAQTMIDNGLLEENAFYQTIADSLGTEFVPLAGEIAPEILRLIPSGLARLHRALPLGASDNGITVALVDPLDLRAAEDLRFALGKDIHVVVAPTTQIEERIKRHYGSDTSSMEEILQQLGEAGELLTLRGDEDALSHVEADANATPIIRFVDLILFQAIQDRASDIHFEPFEHEFKIRYRVDGALYEMAPPPRHLALPVISRVKVMANMNIAERRLPQDGRIQKNVAGRMIDMRVSTLPTQFGESVVLRVLDRSTVNLDLEALGMPDYIHAYIIDVINRPNGIFIVTGPTGSGKTTTLYSCLRKINTIDAKLLTAEEPVEYDLEGIVQVPVNEAIGLTFAP
ncbi:MAG TPA: GspE/PulE family protein, partial [Chthoniobacterales bacterium]|nr:GspE/PulE family protein [Chthoniobacterales bacterium]